MIRLNHPYSCRHCKAVYVILKSYGWYGYLPVEVIRGTEKDDSEFDKEKHKSHLLNCPQLQAQWNDVKKTIIDQQKNHDKIKMKELLK